MRVRIKKRTSGRGKDGVGEVYVNTTESRKETGEMRYGVNIRFTDDALRKIPNTGYLAIEADDELNRLYFVAADKWDGFKLSGKLGQSRVVSLSVVDIDEWKAVRGYYDLRKDVSDNTYYIDIPKCPRV